MIIHQSMALQMTPDVKGLLVLGGLLLAIGAVLLAFALCVYRLLRPRSRDTHRIQVTRLGVFFGVAQAVAMFSIIGWGTFHPETFLGKAVAHHGGAFAIILLVSIVGQLICVAVARAGVVLFYRSQERR